MVGLGVFIPVVSSLVIVVPVLCVMVSVVSPFWCSHLSSGVGGMGWGVDWEVGWGGGGVGWGGGVVACLLSCLPPSCSLYLLSGVLVLCLFSGLSVILSGVLGEISKGSSVCRNWHWSPW